MDIFSIILNLAIGSFFVIGAYLQLQSDVREFAKNDRISLGRDFKMVAAVLVLVSVISHIWLIPLLVVFLASAIILSPGISMSIKEAVQFASLAFSTILVLNKLSNSAELPWAALIAVALAPTVLLLVLKFCFFIKGE